MILVYVGFLSILINDSCPYRIEVMLKVALYTCSD
jgi:hypothetical protein